MTTGRAVALVAVGAGAAYLIWRLNEAQGGTVVFVNPFTSMLPGNPSTAGSEGAGDTNPLTQMFQTITRAFKLPGNASSQVNEESSAGTPVNPVGPPDTVTLTAQPERPAFQPDSGYLPNLGDPNMSAWDYLASTPPDLAWGIKA